MTLDDREQPLRFLVRHRNSRFSGGCDHAFTSEGVTVLRTPVQAPNANAHAERWIGSVRRECLDRLLIFSRRHLEHVLRVYARVGWPKLASCLQITDFSDTHRF
jgi:putative transposase